MLASGRTGLVCKIILLVCLLVIVTTITLIMHALMGNRRPLLHRRSGRVNGYYDPQPSSGSRPERGLMALITNVTKTVVAMEIQANSLNDELKNVREKTRELLIQQRHTALWAVLNKCMFFYGCKDQNTSRPRSAAQSPLTMEKRNPKDTGGEENDSMVRVQKVEHKYSMYRLHPPV